MTRNSELFTTALANDAQIERACALHEQAVIARERRELDRAERIARRALAQMIAAVGEHHPDVANILLNLGGICGDRCDYNAAEQHYRAAVAIMDDLPPGDLDLERLRVRSWLELADLLRHRACYAEAERMLRRALAHAESAAMDADVAAVLNSLGILYKYMGRFDDAAPLYQHALAIFARIYEAEHPALASVYHNLGGLEHARGCFAEGEPYARRSVALRERALGADHPEVAADLAALAGLVEGQGRYTEAEQLYRRALAIFEHAYGPEHYEVAAVLGNLAVVAHTQRRDDAEPLYRRALKLQETLLGSTHPDAALTRSNLGVLLLSLGRRAEAGACYRDAIAAFEAVLGPTHPQVIACHENFAALREVA